MSTPLSQIAWLALPACLLFGHGGQSCAAEKASATVLEEILVTATRRESPLHATSVSASALTGEELRSSGVHDIVDLMSRVPGLNYTDDAFVGHRIAIRGITSGTLLEPRPLTAFYLDETPMMILAGTAAIGSFGGPRVQTMDLERIEVIRGPQGTLFGTSALGGAVRMITRPPDPKGFHASAESAYSSTEHGEDAFELGATVNLPVLVDRAAVRANGFYREVGGFNDNVARSIPDIDGADISGGRIALLWQATPDLAIQLSAHGQERVMSGQRAADVAAGPYQQMRFAPEQDDESWRLYNMTIVYDVPWAELRSITSYLDRRPNYAFDITPFVENVLGLFNPTVNVFDDHIRDVMQELRVTSRDTGRLGWLLGAYFQSQDHDWVTETPSPGFDALTGGLAASFGYPDRLDHTELDAELRQLALYVELTLVIASRWEATLGARWFAFEQEIYQAFDGLLNGGPSELSATTDERGITPQFGLAYRPNDLLLVFFNAAQGFRPGGANQFTAEVADVCSADLAALGIFGPPPPFESDSLWSFELGAKVRSDGRRLALGGAVFYIDWDDMQTFKNLNCGYGFAENAGRATSGGFELELEWRPTDPLDVRFGVSYTDARLAADVPNLSGEDGEPIPTVPRWTVSATGRRGFVLSSKWRGFAEGNVQYAEGAWNDFDQAMRVHTPSRQLVNLRMGATSQRLELELFADNVFGERAVLMHSKNIVGEWQVTSPPRTIGVRARMEL